MNMQKPSLLKALWFGWLVCGLAGWLGAQPAQAAEHKLQARLIWGTNDEHFSNPKFRPVDPKTTRRLQKIFRWRRYFEVNRKLVRIREGRRQTVRMSDKCQLEITPRGRSKLEIIFIGEGKKLNRMTRHFRPGESAVIGGGLKDGSAWFVILTELEDR